MNTQVIITLKLLIPESEVAEISNEDLVEWLKFNVGEAAQMKVSNQFHHYELSDFHPDIKECWKNAKRLI